MKTPSAGMRFVDSRCINCNATLRVAQDADLVCCHYCNSELQVVRDGSALTTRLLAGIDEIKGHLGQKLDIVRLQNDIERLDREWSLEREKFMVHGKGGSSIPSGAGSLITGLVAASVALIWTISAASMGAPVLFPLFGIVFIGIALVQGLSGMSKAAGHSAAQNDYQMRRRSLLGQLTRLDHSYPQR